jgi:hypothetical protein
MARLLERNGRDEMPDPIVYVDHSEIRDGKLEDLKAAMNELIGFVEANEPQLIAYHVYFTEDNTRMTVLHIHAGSASLEFHMKIAGPLFPRFAQFIKLLRIDVYGKPTYRLVEQMRQKAQTLGSGSVAVHELHAGFARLSMH